MHSTTPMLTSVNDACAALNVGRTSLYSLINSGRLDTVKLGRRTLVKVSSIKALAGEAEASA